VSSCITSSHANAAVSRCSRRWAYPLTSPATCTGSASAGQLRRLGHHVAAPDDQPGAPRAQRRVHLAQADGEKRGPVGSVEPAGQDRGVEHEHRHDPLMGMYGVPQNGVVAQAQVAGEQ
jgi:hypothetical protein